MTCKCTECIHEALCMDRLSKQGYSDYAKRSLIVEDCEHFKNKADFVEVVRCSECKKGKPMIFAGFYFCKRHRKCRTKYCFCSDGERVTDTNVGSK